MKEQKAIRENLDAGVFIGAIGEPCEDCFKVKGSVRFEGSEEAFLCDSCLSIRRGVIKENG